MLRDHLPPIGLLEGARIIADTTDTKCKNMTTNFNSHHQFFSIKSLVLVAENSCLLGVVVGHGGNEADVRIFRESDLYRQIVSGLADGERFFAGDGSFTDRAVYFPVQEQHIMAADPNLQPALRVYNAELQLHRARVEHAIGRSKTRWSALREIPSIQHQDVETLITMIFASWLLEARMERLHG